MIQVYKQHSRLFLELNISSPNLSGQLLKLEDWYQVHCVQCHWGLKKMLIPIQALIWKTILYKNSLQMRVLNVSRAGIRL